MEAEPARPSVEWEPAPEQGWVAPRIAAEFPGLGIATVEVDGRRRRSPEPVRQRLRELSDRFFGAHAIHMRERPVPWAYRVFYRQIGLDPDQAPTPVEQLARERLLDGAFRSRGLPDDALAIAIVETGVALHAFDAERLAGALCIREAGPGEALAGSGPGLDPGTLVIADERHPVALLFGPAADGPAVNRGTRRIALAAIQVNAVPQMAVDEALWIAATVLDSA